MRNTNRARLTVQPLEVREVPACVVWQSNPATLMIVGNAASDIVVVKDDGANGISGSATGWGAFNFQGISSVRVSTGSGNDHVVYNLTHNLLPGQTRYVDVFLGPGTNSFTANLFNVGTGVGSDLMANSHLNITAWGENGADTLRVNAQHDVDVAVGASLHTELYGQGGNDVIFTYFKGENDGDVYLGRINGGAGNDYIRAVLKEDFGSTGKSRGLVEGGDGFDNIGLSMFTQHPPVLGLLDGGNGLDVGIATPNVTKINIP
jgi:hypothetical protein